MKDASFWNRMAERYAKMPIRNSDSYEQTLERTRSYLSPDAQVLELGCGTGSTALLLADAAGHITASDYAENMIAIARRKAAEQAIENVTFVLADASGDGLPDGPFDVICTFNLLHLVPDLDTTLAAIAAKTRPGGTFISKTVCLADPGLSLKLRAMLWLALPVMQMLGKAPRVAKLSITTLQDAITRAGFEIVETANQPANPPSRFIVARRPG